jgi:predicted alpha/beta superfamily hydrolase
VTLIKLFILSTLCLTFSFTAFAVTPLTTSKAVNTGNAIATHEIDSNKINSHKIDSYNIDSHKIDSHVTISSVTEGVTIPRSYQVEITDPVSQLTYPLFIKLPKNYDNNKHTQYPVIYLTDAWYSFQIVSGATRYPMNIGTMEQAILVGISYAKGSRGDSSRVRDYTPSVDPSWKQQTGGAQQHIAFIQNQVFPYIEQHYRADPSKRTFVGNSLGGLLGTYILLTKPEMFRNYVLGSPSYWFDNKMIFKLEAELALQYVRNSASIDINNKTKAKAKLKANVFIAIGERETIGLDSELTMVEDAKAFYARMQTWQQLDLTTKLLIIPDANHQTAFPTTAIQGLHWIHQAKQ